MRATLKFAAAVAVGFALAPVGSSRAADTPTAAQIIDSLTPGSNGPAMTTRGIRLGSQPPEVAKPGTEASTAARVKPAQGSSNRGEANLSIPFATGSATVSPSAARVLDQLGEALTSPKLADFRFRVEGHTDTVGAPELNKTLSERRAANVSDYLATKFNVDRNRLVPVGMGEDGLLIPTGQGVANSANRRVLVVNLGH